MNYNKTGAKVEASLTAAYEALITAMEAAAIEGGDEATTKEFESISLTSINTNLKKLNGKTKTSLTQYQTKHNKNPNQIQHKVENEIQNKPRFHWINSKKEKAILNV